MKQTVEEAANKYRSDNVPSLDKFPKAIKKAFIAGTEWQSEQSPWISVKERLPGEYQNVLVRCEYEGKSLYSVAFMMDGKWKCRDGKPTHWMPIPTFDQILEANKDVLQRMKEKGY